MHAVARVCSLKNVFGVKEQENIMGKTAIDVMDAVNLTKHAENVEVQEVLRFNVKNAMPPASLQGRVINAAV